MTKTEKPKRTITGFLVNAADKTIEPVTLPFRTNDHMQKMYELIGCTCFDCVRLPGNNTAWVDDEGLINDPQHFVFINGGHPDPLAGNVLFLGPSDRNGNTLSCTIPLSALQQSVMAATVGEGGWQRLTVKETVQ
jgi:hypothetical protein